jgi:hypothetical protein
MKRTFRRILAAAVLPVLAAALAAACGGTRAQADQDRDGRLMASALRSAYSGGVAFKLDQQLMLTGGDVPAGKAYEIHALVSDGVMKDDAARFTYRLVQGRQTASYDMLIAGSRLFAKQHSASAWKETPLQAATALFPVLRLDLVRETVLLASSVGSSSVAHVDAGFVRKYPVRPAPDQLEQLESMPVSGQAEAQFLRTATAELDVFLTYPDNKLGRVEVHLTGTDPSSGTRQEIQGSIDVRPTRVGTTSAPTDAQQVAPGDLLS